MIKDDDNFLDVSKKHLKDIEGHLKSGSNPVTGTDISNMRRCVIDGIKSGMEHNTGVNKEITTTLGVSLKHATESLKYLSNALSTLYSKLNKGGK